MLLVARSWHGTGGLQQLNRDLWRGIRQTFPQATIIRPQGNSRVALIACMLRAIVVGIAVGRSGGQVHLGDASLCVIGVFIHRLTGARVTVTVAGLDVIYPARWYQWLLRRSLPSMHRVCAISRATAEAVAARGVPKERIVEIPCGLWMDDVPALRSTVPAQPVLLSVCRLVERKGIAWFLDAVMPRLIERFPTIDYRIIGDGPERMRMEKIIAERSLQSHVHLLGAVDTLERQRQLAEASLLITPNIRVAGDMEGFGIACIEASACGVPVAASDSGGLRDAVIDGKTGMHFRAGNADDALRVIDALLRSPLDRSTVRATTLHSFDWSHLLIRYEHDVFA